MYDNPAFLNFLIGVLIIMAIVIVALVVAVISMRKTGDPMVALTMAAKVIENFTASSFLTTIAEYAGANVPPEFAAKIAASLNYANQLAPNGADQRLVQSAAVAWQMITDGKANTAEGRDEIYRKLFGKEPPADNTPSAQVSAAA